VSRDGKASGLSTLLEKTLQQADALPEDEQDAIASQILSSRADEEAWRKRFATERDVMRRMAQGSTGGRRAARRARWTICFDAVARHGQFRRLFPNFRLMFNKI
jgi:hypothetical protein